MLTLANDIYVQAAGFVATALTLGTVVWKFAKKVDPNIVKQLPQDVVHTGEEIGAFFANLAKSPLFAGIAAKGKIEAHHVVSKLEDTELAKVAIKGVSAFSKALNVVLDDMTATQKTDLVEFVKAELAKVKVNVSDAQIVDALKGAQGALNAVEKDVIPAVKAHDAAVKAWATPAQPQPAPAEQGQMAQPAVQA